MPHKLPDANIYLERIAKALAEYTPCDDRNCGCHADTIAESLAPFKAAGGITKAMIDSVADLGVKYQIIDHKLYREPYCMFPNRCTGIEFFINANIHKLPDLEMIVNCRDWPQINVHNKRNFGPVFSFSKTNQHIDIMYPAWSFREGGPAISLYPTGLGRWDSHRQSINDAANDWTWQKKEPIGFFRGSRTSHERDSLVLLSRRLPNLVDGQYTKNQAWRSPKDTLNADPVKEVPLEEHCRYKFLFNFRGVAASFRFKHLFLCKSLVFHVGNEWMEFFYGALKPWVHYVPLDSNPTEQELEDIIRFFREHDDLARDIAERGHRQIWEHLKMKDVHCYWRKLLRKYAKLLKFEVKLDEKLIAV